MSIEPTEIRIGYIDDQNLQHIDCYFTDSDTEEGRTAAVVDLDTKKVIFFDNIFRASDKVQNVIKKILSPVQFTTTIASCMRVEILDINKAKEIVEGLKEVYRTVNYEAENKFKIGE